MRYPNHDSARRSFLKKSMVTAGLSLREDLCRDRLPHMPMPKRLRLMSAPCSGVHLSLKPTGLPSPLPSELFAGTGVNLFAVSRHADLPAAAAGGCTLLVSSADWTVTSELRTRSHVGVW